MRANKSGMEPSKNDASTAQDNVAPVDVAAQAAVVAGAEADGVDIVCPPPLNAVGGNFDGGKDAAERMKQIEREKKERMENARRVQLEQVHHDVCIYVCMYVCVCVYVCMHAV
jgi:hypothetical protein